MSRLRLDVAIEAAGLAPSRSRARDLIQRGQVLIDGQPAQKPGQLVASDARLTLVPDALPTVGRGSLKLGAAFEAFGAPFTACDRHVLDLGASTGGFTEMLLARGAAHVTAVDVGREQLHPSLATDPRVTDLSPFDVRALTAGALPRAQRAHLAPPSPEGAQIAPPVPERADIAPPSALVADLSFIGLRQAIGPALALIKGPTPSAAAPAEARPWVILLVKPQFEVGRQNIGKGGIVRDPAARAMAVAAVCDWLATQGWQASTAMVSPVVGKGGNVEFLVGAVPSAPPLSAPKPAPAELGD